MNPQAALAHLYVLAGGESRRFGSDKALADIDGAPMIRRVIERLAPAIATEGVGDTKITLVTGSTPRYESFGYPVICDRPCGVGPIGGLAAALGHRQENDGPGWVLVASCDLVRPRARWVEALVRAFQPGALAVAYASERWEPMLALYHTDLLPVVQRQIERDMYSMQLLLSAASAVRVPLPDGISSLPQANTPDQLRSALAQEGAA